MKIICVDDEKIGLEAQIDSILKVEPDASIFAFKDGESALELVETGVPVDVCFLDINLRGMNGVHLAQKIKMINPKINIIFATGYDNYLSEAFKLHASGYIMKPITAAKVKSELDNLRNPVDETDVLMQENAGKNGEVEVRIKAFGNFEIYANDMPVKFKYYKTKEMVAYMVDRQGTLCSNGEIISTLWEDDQNHSSYLRGLRKDLVDVLSELGRMDVINQQRGKIGINPKAVICDYYQFISGDPNAINLYRGEYMSQYSWGEFTNATIDVNSLKK